MSLDSFKVALRDKNKVFLSNSGKHDFFQIFNNGQELFNGLNVVLGGRSSGKTYLLNRLEKSFNTEEKSVKYIKQFDLVKEDEAKFNKHLEKEKSEVREKYLKEFRQVVEDVMKIDRRGTDYKIEKFVESLLEFASSEKMQDEFSKSILFTETPFTLRKDTEIVEVIKATRTLLENLTYKTTISKYLPEAKLKALLSDLENQFKEKKEEYLKKDWINGIIELVGQKLKHSTSRPNIKNNDIDFFSVKIEKKSVAKFNAIVKAIKKRKTIAKNQSFGKFKIHAVASPYGGAGELLAECGKQTSFSPAFKKYEYPIDYLEHLNGMRILEKAELYKYFCKITYQVLNKYGKQVSGGERAEFNLLRVLQDARQYEMLLIDEPESSFDNLFLKETVNKEIKEISTELPVIVVTHNNTVGMLMHPDYILFTRRNIIDDKDEYQLFSGSPGDKDFKTADGKETIESYRTLLDTLEAGEDAYDSRGGMYKSYKK